EPVADIRAAGLVVEDRAAPAQTLPLLVRDQTVHPIQPGVHGDAAEAQRTFLFDGGDFERRAPAFDLEPRAAELDEARLLQLGESAFDRIGQFPAQAGDRAIRGTG